MIVSGAKYRARVVKDNPPKRLETTTTTTMMVAATKCEAQGIKQPLLRKTRVTDGELVTF